MRVRRRGKSQCAWFLRTRFLSLEIDLPLANFETRSVSPKTQVQKTNLGRPPCCFDLSVTKGFPFGGGAPGPRGSRSPSEKDKVKVFSMREGCSTRRVTGWPPLSCLLCGLFCTRGG